MVEVKRAQIQKKEKRWNGIGAAVHLFRFIFLCPYVPLFILFRIHAYHIVLKRIHLVRLVINSKTVCLWWNECVLEQSNKSLTFLLTSSEFSRFFEEFLSYIINAVLQFSVRNDTLISLEIAIQNSVFLRILINAFAVWVSTY